MSEVSTVVRTEEVLVVWWQDVILGRITVSR